MALDWGSLISTDRYPPSHCPTLDTEIKVAQMLRGNQEAIFNANEPFVLLTAAMHWKANEDPWELYTD